MFFLPFTPQIGGGAKTITDRGMILPASAVLQRWVWMEDHWCLKCRSQCAPVVFRCFPVVFKWHGWNTAVPKQQAQQIKRKRKEICEDGQQTCLI